MMWLDEREKEELFFCIRMEKEKEKKKS